MAVSARRQSPSLRPAMIPLAIGFVVVFGGIALSLAVDSGSTSVPSATPGQRLPGVALAAIPAKPALAAIVANDEPPANVVASLVIPDGSSVTGHENEDGGLSQFDRIVYLAVDARPGKVVAFFKAEMAHYHWSQIGKDLAGTSSGNEDQLFYQIGGTDGYYWQVGLTITSESPAITPALGGVTETGPTTKIGIEIDQAEDGD